jgi:hypothetical protein
MNGLLYDMEAVKTALSKSAAFRTWCGAASEAAALAYISLFTSDLSKLPCAVVNNGAGWRSECRTLDGEHSVIPEVVVEFVRSVAKTDTDATVFTALLTAVSGVIEDLRVYTAYPIQSFAPESDETPVRAKHQSTDLIAFRLVITGFERD